MKIYIASDHAGFQVKEKIKLFLAGKKIACEDMGTHSLAPVDYPEYAIHVSQQVARDKTSRGILICGTGTGMTIVANKVRGIRAVAAYDAYSAKMSRIDNDTNVLGLRGRSFPLKKILTIIAVWLRTPFSGNPRHQRRRDKIASFEKRPAGKRIAR